MKNLLVAIVLYFVFTGCVLAQQPQPTFHDELLDHFQGSWVLQGTIGGKPTTQDVTNDWVLNHQFLRIHEVSREKNAKGEREYEAMVLVGWDQPTGRYLAIWLDVWGGFSKGSVGYAPKQGDDIKFIFNDGKSNFYTTFIYDRKADTWEWHMDAEDNGVLKPYARVKLTRPTK